MQLNEPSGPETQSKETSTARLVGAGFGLIVWAIYFLVVYIAEAIFCTLLPTSTPEARLFLHLALAAATAIALVPVAAHVLIHLTADRTVPDKDFLSRLALALDGIAAIGIVDADPDSLGSGMSLISARAFFSQMDSSGCRQNAPDLKGESIVDAQNRSHFCA